MKYLVVIGTLAVAFFSCTKTSGDTNPIKSNDNFSSSVSSSIKTEIDTTYIQDSTGKIDTIYIVKKDTIYSSSSEISESSISSETSISSSSVESSSQESSVVTSSSISSSESSSTNIDIDLKNSNIEIDTLKESKTYVVGVDDNGEIPLKFTRANGVGVINGSIQIGSVLLPLNSPDSIIKKFTPDNGEFIEITIEPTTPLVVQFGLNADEVITSSSSIANSVSSIDPSLVDSLYDLNFDPNKERMVEFTGDLSVGVMPRAKDDGSYYGIEFTFVAPTDSSYWPEGKYSGTVTYSGITETISGQYSSKYKVQVANGDGIIFKFHFDNKIKMYTGVAW